ncbi:Hsp20/alpha crystallin family protein [Cytobacillus purgationiresistens]|uniref:HSP20 family molecular chaperone IbpA n=1 Tax=Cytobacillus purgationiresistens TaxID=863449 RepID=A0ABU0AS56_9BACI|nr:Hsp20/alpha crystallin family protein [Cytobacillus purgationiresistens]MDQ0273709.1 HSP20 family molecular chaperone IbpA [Cytobacillus purgationiresistens]
MFPWNLFPFDKEMKSKMQHMKPDDINQYIQEMMGKAFPNDMMKNGSFFDGASSNDSSENKRKDHTASTLPSSIFETHEFVFVRVKMKDEEWLRQMKIYHTSNLLIIEHIPDIEDKHTITLPALVNRKGAKADYHDEVLEIKLFKSMDRQLSEIHVSDI